jgi:hypothetical protein
VAGEVHAGTNATTIEERVAYLLRRDQDAQLRVNALEERLSSLEIWSRRRIAEVQQEMERHVAGELTAAEEKYRSLRVAGTVALLVGLICTGLATLLSWG